MHNESDGYYGSDQLMERLFEKPIVSTANLNGYVGNSNSSLILMQIRTAVKFDRIDEFKAFLDLLSIKYIVQRNDVNDTKLEQFELRNNVNITTYGRDLVNPGEMRAFFNIQPYLKLERSFGELDIYEYVEAKPSMFVLLPSALEKTDINIGKSTNLDKVWNFSFQNDVSDWKKSTLPDQSQATCLINQKNGNLIADMSNLTSSWITVNSPLMPAHSEVSYLVNATFSAKNNQKVTVAIAEYSENMTLLHTSSFAEIKYGNGTFTQWFVSFRFEPKNENTKFFQLQIWNYFNATETGQSSLMLDNVSVLGTSSSLKMSGIENLYENASENSQILIVQNVSPAKIVATINATQPFILVNNQELDRFWVAYFNGEQAPYISPYLGLGGFLINGTGEFTIVLEYKPQLWFNYSMAISGVTVLLLCLGLLYVSKDRIKFLLGNLSKRSRNTVE